MSRAEHQAAPPEPGVHDVGVPPDAVEARPEAVKPSPEAAEPEPGAVDAEIAAPEPAAPEPAPEPEAVETGPEASTPEPTPAGEPDATPASAPEPTIAPAAWPEISARPAASPSAPAFSAPSNPAGDQVAADGLASGGIVPGSYLPPSTVHRAGVQPGEYGAPSAPGGPAPWEPPAPAASSAGWIPPAPGAAGAMAGGAASATPSVGPSATTQSRDGRPSTPGRASILADLPFDAPDELEGWLVALGGGMGVLGFFLPWTGAIGDGLEGYLGSWGLGAASRLPIFFLLVVVSALAILPNRVATWVRTGVCGMVAGGILFGLVWLYMGSDASQLGALLAAVGSVLLIAGGIIAVAPGRSAERHDDT